MTGSIIIAAKLIGAGLAMIGAIGAGAGIGIVTSGAVQAMGRNPDATGTIQTYLWLLGHYETGLRWVLRHRRFTLVVALLILFVVG